MGNYSSFDVPVYCINLLDATSRLERMKNRFDTMNFKDVTFVPAASANSKLVTYYTKGTEDWYANIKYFDGKDQFRKDIGCFASHLLAMRMFIASGKSRCIICEDDILFHNNFVNIYQDIIAHLPENAPLLSLSYMLTDNIDQEYIYKSSETPINQETWTIEKQQEIWKSFNKEKEHPEIIMNKDPIYHGIWKIDPDDTWGAQAYYITAEYALEVIKKFDKPLILLTTGSELAMNMLKKDKKITSEIFIRTSGGYMSSIPLVIEDCIDSCRAPQDIPYHLRLFCRWDWNNYNRCDYYEESPLSRLNPNDSYPGYPYSKHS